MWDVWNRSLGLGPVTLTRLCIGEGGSTHELYRGDEREDGYAVDPRADHRPQPLPVGADRWVLEVAAGVRLRRVQGVVLGPYPANPGSR
jgi:hypothetical protein